jgi:hypothetical protein
MLGEMVMRRQKRVLKKAETTKVECSLRLGMSVRKLHDRGMYVRRATEMT